MSECRQIEIDEKEYEILLFYRNLSEEKKDIFRAFLQSLTSMLEEK